MKIKGVIFDENGVTYSIDNLEIFVGDMKDALLAKSYVRTIFHHESILKIEELVKEGKVEAVATAYNAELTMNAIAAMRDEIVERFGEEYHNYLITKIDL